MSTGIAVCKGPARHRCPLHVARGDAPGRYRGAAIGHRGRRRAGRCWRRDRASRWARTRHRGRRRAGRCWPLLARDRAPGGPSAVGRGRLYPLYKAI